MINKNLFFIGFFCIFFTIKAKFNPSKDVHDSIDKHIEHRIDNLTKKKKNDLKKKLLK